MRRLGRFIWLIITTLVVAIAIAFASSNEALVTLYLWPLDGMLTAPTWLVVVSSFIIGGLLSIFLMWAQMLAIRAKLWNLQVRFNRLEEKMDQQQSAETKRGDKRPDRGLTANYEPAPYLRDRETKTFLPEPPRTNHTLR